LPTLIGTLITALFLFQPALWLPLSEAPLSPQAAQTATQPKAPPDPNRFESEIKKFDEADLAAMPPANGIVFTGSSSIRLWTTMAEDFQGMTTLNRGFGGSEVADAIRYVDRLVIRYQPAQVVFYSGDNDLFGGKTPAQVAADYKTFVAAIHAKLPRTRVVLISIKPSLARWSLADQARDTNGRLREMAAKDPKRLAYVDVFATMLGSDGRPRPELYVADGLHMTQAGYAIWKDALGPVLRVAAGSTRTPLLTP
jgi:lysophospholipase L1-like esterase